MPSSSTKAPPTRAPPPRNTTGPPHPRSFHDAAHPSHLISREAPWMWPLGSGYPAWFIILPATPPKDRQPLHPEATGFGFR